MNLVECDLVECALDVGLVGLADFVEDVPDLVSPAALHGNAVQDDRQGSQQAAVEALAGEPVTVKRLGDLAHRLGADRSAQDRSNVSPTLRVDSPSTKAERITRSISGVRRA